MIYGGRNDLAMKAEELCKLGGCEAWLLGAAGMDSKWGRESGFFSQPKIVTGLKRIR